MEGFKKSFMLWIKGIGDTLSGPLLIAFGLVETAVASIIELLKGAFKIVVGLVSAMIPPSLIKLMNFVGRTAVKGAGVVGDVLDGGPGAALAYPGGASPGAFPGISGLQTASVTHNKYEINAPVTVPPGTSEQQAAFLETTMQRVVEESLGRHIGHVMQNNPRRE